MKNKLKLFVAAFGIGLASMSNMTLASFNFPDLIGACIEQGMKDYCRSTGQFDSCAVPTHIYHQIQQSCY